MQIKVEIDDKELQAEITNIIAKKIAASWSTERNLTCSCAKFSHPIEDGRWIALAGRQHITYYTFLVLIQLLHQVALTAVF